jgi:hypothetical protein
MEAEQMRQLLDSVSITRKIKVPAKHGGGPREVPDIKGLRDRAIIAIMGYTFGRVSAVIGVKHGDYRHEGKRARLRLLENPALKLRSRHASRLPGRIAPCRISWQSAEHRPFLG